MVVASGNGTSRCHSRSNRSFQERSESQEDQPWRRSLQGRQWKTVRSAQCSQGLQYEMLKLEKIFFVNAFFVEQQAEAKIAGKKLDKEYSPISGNPEFCQHSINLALGDGNETVANKLVRCSQDFYTSMVYCIFCYRSL